MPVKFLIFATATLAMIASAVSADPLRVAYLNAAHEMQHASKSQEAKIQKTFSQSYDALSKDFDYDQLAFVTKNIQDGFTSYKQSHAFNGYVTLPAQPHCDFGESVQQADVQKTEVVGVSPFPGGMVQRVFGGSLAKEMMKLSESAVGPASAAQPGAAVLLAQGLSTGAGMLQSMIAAAIHIIPPMIPPPAWNNQPLTCVPMVTGHNCFGAVLHPITMADFVLADVTDSMLDGYVASFPNTYATKVGRTSDAQYEACFSAYMSMMCSSLFPRCTAPQSRDEPSPVGGRVPMCFHMCISTLVMCPGFWLSDIEGPCSEVSLPPMCSMAVFTNTKLAPPQLTTFDESEGFALECPKVDTSNGGMDMAEDPNLYEATSTMAESSIGGLPQVVSQ